MHFFLICCDNKTSQSNQPKIENSKEDNESDSFMILYDIAFAEWFTHQSFSMEVIAYDNGKEIFQYPGFSSIETRTEDVIEIQRESLQKLIDYEGKVDKIARVSQWFETQLKAEKVLLSFLSKDPLSLHPTQIRELIETGEYYTDVLTRQKILLELIRRKTKERRVNEK